MKQLFLILFIVPLLLACSSDEKNDADYSDLIVGTWDMVYSVGYEAGSDGRIKDEWDHPIDDVYYIFSENNKGQEYNFDNKSGGLEIVQLEWYVLDRKLILKRDPGEKNEYTYSQDIKELSNGKMVLYSFSKGLEILEVTTTFKKRK